MKKLLLPIFSIFLCTTTHAQILEGTDTLYGNEWIDFTQTYFKIPVTDDGMFRLTGQQMTDAGVPAGTITGDRYSVFHNGKELFVFTSTAGTFGSSDFIEFYGEKNRSELDQYLFADPDSMMMNPYYSMFTDTAAYFLTWKLNGFGKRFQTLPNELNNLPPKEEYYLHEDLQVLPYTYFKPGDGDGVRNSYFEMEGFAGSHLLSSNFTFTPNLPYSGPVNAELKLRYGVTRFVSHKQVTKVNGQVILTDEFQGQLIRNPALEVENASLSAQVQVSLEGLASTIDYHRVSHISLKYPRQFNFNGQPAFGFEVAASPSVKYLEISNFQSTGGTPVLYDLTNGWRLEGLSEGGLVKIALPASAVSRRLLLHNSAAGSKPSPAPLPVQFIDYQNLNADFIIISNKALFDDGAGANPVQQYADYRASAAGGGHTSVVAEVQQLYDQFAWGINRHPLSIRNFCQFAMKNWDRPRYLFVIGRGREFPDIRYSNNTPGQLPMLVPTYGAPGSDMLLSAPFYQRRSDIPTGRLAASEPGQVSQYLKKVKAFEQNVGLPQTIADRLWMKRILHLGGGGDLGEQSLIKGHLKLMENILTESKMGAKVWSFYKTSSDPVQQSTQQEITNLINSGLSIITLFGHASSSGFDFTVDDPSTYKNYGKYPLVISMGCFSGQIHQSAPTVGDHFVFQDDKGAIAFLATTGFGYVHALNQTGQRFFSLLGNDLYGKGLGDILRQTTGEMANADFGAAVLAQQFTLHADPSIVMNAQPTPDFVPDQNSAAIEPERINAQQNAFKFKFNAVNIGSATADSLTVEVKREFPNGNPVLVAKQKFPAPKYEEPYEFTVPVLGKQAAGFNKIHVTLDPDNAIAEERQPEAETNNVLKNQVGETGFRFYIYANGALPVYPEDFSIVNDGNLTLTASTSDAFVKKQRYFWEIDSTGLFNSPLKQAFSAESGGGVLQWKPSIPWKSDQAYYWRISPDTTGGLGYVWANSSFLSRPDLPPGWNQSHFFQLKKDQFSNTELPDATRRLKFIDDVKTFKIINGKYPNVLPTVLVGNISYWFYFWGSAASVGLQISVFDSLTVNPWLNAAANPYGSINYYDGWGAFPFFTGTTAQRENVIKFLRDVVPSGNYVSISTIQSTYHDYKPGEWAADSVALGANIFQLLEQQGAHLIRSTAATGPKPYVFFYKKDDPSFTPFEQLVEPDDTIEHSFSIAGSWFEGYVESTLIGPAQHWDSLLWKTSEVNPAVDKFSVNVYGVKADSTSTLLFEKVQAPSLDLSSVNTAEFPYLKLRYNSLDSIDYSPPQLNFWRIYYKGLPDAAVDPNTLFTFYKDTLQEGDAMKVELAVKNVGRYDLDSLLMKFSVRDLQNNEVVKQERLAALPKNGQLTATWQLDTRGLQGKQQLILEVNPGPDQPELYAFNNLAFRDFYVEKDARNPLVEVTFDGVRILNGDIVSPKPRIVMNVLDENQYLLLDDTSYFKVFLRLPDAPDDPVLIPWSSSDLKLIPPSQQGKNKASIEYTPHFTTDGIYSLTLQARDASGNASGALAYKVSFSVITKSSLSNVLNYPNPFSTSTRFVYTLTGEESPTQFRIQIFTISGRVVREITQDELGPLRIGTHQTDYAWNGRDEFGDPLANGVYLYRIIARKANGEEYELRENTTADHYFDKGFGKMVIVR